MLYVDSDLDTNFQSCMDKDDKKTWSFTTPEPVRMGVLSVTKFMYKDGFNDGDIHGEVFSSFNLNRGISVNNITGYYFNSRSTMAFR